tara:strand:- start:5147 stop:5533 length:387 start_codon:yes stop_codon:yes gene_type:complete
MSRVIPKIFSGNRQLIVSETICFDPMEGLLIDIPITSGGKSDYIQIDFDFPVSSELEKGKVETKVTDKIIKISVCNFGDAIISGLVKPLTFNLGNTKIWLSFTGMLLSNKEQSEQKLLQFTISIFSEN